MSKKERACARVRGRQNSSKSKGSGRGPGTRTRPGADAATRRMEGLGFRVPRLGSRVPRLGSRVPRLGYRVSRLGSRSYDSHTGSRDSHTGSRDSDPGSRDLDPRSRDSDTGSRNSDIALSRGEGSLSHTRSRYLWGLKGGSACASSRARDARQGGLRAPFRGATRAAQNTESRGTRAAPARAGETRVWMELRRAGTSARHADARFADPRSRRMCAKFWYVHAPDRRAVHSRASEGHEHAPHGRAASHA